MKWGWKSDSISQALLNKAELQALYQRAHASSLPHSQRLLEQSQLGDVASRYRGSGLDYEESRIYQDGDEPRFINWQLTARSDKTQVKQFREERRPSVFILLDHRATMRFGTQVRLKAAQASRIAALIAFAASQQGWAVSAARLDADDVHWFPLSTDSHDIWMLVEECAGACPPMNTDSPTAEPISLVNLLPLINTQLIRGAHIYLLSDFIDLDTDCNAPLLQLQNHHPLFTVQIIDPIEKELPKAGQVSLQGDNLENTLSVDLSDAKVRENFKQQSSNHHHAIKQQLQGLGCNFYHLLTTVESPEKHIPLPHGLGT